ncbi:aldo/keto reductase [Hymenobacter terrenus]|uniref:aldo/keto reductase n=1 Tax=Hymenobacter terrenus TaxID=1629124 RepID=UPI00061990BE|nr:aldo/keto reductase [Hymenobacter terrenus]
MQYNEFARTGKQVARIGYGAMGLGGAFGSFDEAEGIRSVLTYLERGGNFIDTARHYGKSEEILGKALAQWKGERPFLASKIQSHGPDNTRWCLPPAVEETFPRHLIRQNTEDSLRRLGVDSLDLMQLHLYWPTWGTSGYWLDELLTLKAEGKIEAIGVSMPDCRADLCLPLVMAGAVDAVQIIYNLFDPTPLDCVIPICQQHNVAIIARCVLDEGGLTGFLTEDLAFEPQDFRQTFFGEVPRTQYIERVDALKEFVPQHAGSLAKLALKFVLKHPGVTTAISSMHIERFAIENMEAAAEPPLSDEAFYELRTRHRWVRNFYTKKYWQQNDLDAANAVEAAQHGQS